MFDRFNVWVGSLIVRSQDLSLKRDEGQTFVEYVLVISVVSVGILLAVVWADLHTALADGIAKVADAISGTSTP
jgi:Flp pilus assembly pilin Flp